jgi:hypothetical protein
MFLQSAWVLGALGHRVAVIAAGQGISRRGTSDEQALSGDALRKLLVQMETKIEVDEANLAHEEIETQWGRLGKRGRDAASPSSFWGRRMFGIRVKTGHSNTVRPESSNWTDNITLNAPVVATNRTL